MNKQTAIKELQEIIFNLKDKGQTDDKIKLLKILEHEINLLKIELKDYEPLTLKQKIKQLVKDSDEEGLLIDELNDMLKEHEQDEINKAVIELLNDGYIYEPRPNKLRYL